MQIAFWTLKYFTYFREKDIKYPIFYLISMLEVYFLS